MTTKFIGTKELRQNLFSISKEVGAGKAQYIVMNKNKPMFTMSPFKEDEVMLVPSKRLKRAIKDAEEEYAGGRLHAYTTVDDFLKSLR